MQKSWREQQGYRSSLVAVQRLLLVHSLRDIADQMGSGDLSRLASQLRSASSGVRVPAEAMVAAIGLLAQAAHLLQEKEEVYPCLQALLDSDSLPSRVRSAAAWAAGYLQIAECREVLETLVGKDGISDAVERALDRLQTVGM